MSASPIQHVFIVLQNLESEKQVHGFITTGGVAGKGAVTGAWMVGLVGLMIAGVVNVFLTSSAGAIIFTTLTAYGTRQSLSGGGGRR